MCSFDVLEDDIIVEHGRTERAIQYAQLLCWSGVAWLEHSVDCVCVCVCVCVCSDHRALGTLQTIVSTVVLFLFCTTEFRPIVAARCVMACICQRLAWLSLGSEYFLTTRVSAASQQLTLSRSDEH